MTWSESRPGPVSPAALGRREPVLAQQRHQRGGEDHLALRGGRLQLLRDAAAGELLADVEQPRVEVDVAPAEAERLADAEAAVGQEREEDAVRAGVGDDGIDKARASSRAATHARRRAGLRGRAHEPDSESGAARTLVAGDPPAASGCGVRVP